MPSIIPGYEYDIFISYRHKDNRYDHWVTDFVNNLKVELETTFRYQLNIYVDLNPTDGLRENHDVDDSVKEKLKCLVFIPVISHTYCDESSFAWANEFRAFVSMVASDNFGLKLKLLNGNIASRVLPVIIHDLSSDEKLLCERALGSQLRGIDFVYREPGVNRPLRSNEESVQNHISYRNQINKVANSLKDIVTAMMASGNITVNQLSNSEVDYHGKSKGSTGKKSGILIVAAVLLLAISVSFLTLLHFRSDKNIEKSIAVLPFTSDNPEEENFVLTNGLMDEILLSLQTIKNLRVISRTSVEQYRNELRPSTPEIARALGVNYIVEGSIQKSGNSFQLRVELIRATGKEASVWGKSYPVDLTELDNIFNLQSEIAESIVREMDIAITPGEKNVIEEMPTENLEAYSYFQRAREAVLSYQMGPDYTNTDPIRVASINFRKTLAIDSTFSKAYSGLAFCYLFNNVFFNLSSQVIRVDSLMDLIEKAIRYDEHNAEAYFAKAGYYVYLGESEKALRECNIALKYNPNYWEVYHSKATVIYRWNHKRGNLVRALENLKTAINLNSGKNLSILLNDFRKYTWQFWRIQ